MFFLKMLVYARPATVHVRGPSDYDLVCGWQESLSLKGKEIFKILQSKGKKKGEEETLYVSNLQKSPGNIFCSANSSQITKEGEKKASALSVMETSKRWAFPQNLTI
jgi:hypothetical protein